MVGKSDGSDESERELEKKFTEQDLLLGIKASNFINIICVVAFLTCVAIAVFVLFSVPLETKLPYTGKYNRSGDGMPMPIALLLALIFLFIFWRSGRKPDAHHMAKGSRVGLYILGTILVVGSVIGQIVIAKSILVEGGYLTG